MTGSQTSRKRTEGSRRMETSALGNKHSPYGASNVPDQKITSADCQNIWHSRTRRRSVPLTKEPSPGFAFFFSLFISSCIARTRGLSRESQFAEHRRSGLVVCPVQLYSDSSPSEFFLRLVPCFPFFPFDFSGVARLLLIHSGRVVSCFMPLCPSAFLRTSRLLFVLRYKSCLGRSRSFAYSACFE